MATLQVKNLPDDLHDALRRRAASAGISLSEFVTGVLRREAALPTIDEWLARQADRPLVASDVDMTSLMDDIRGEFERG